MKLIRAIGCDDLPHARLFDDPLGSIINDVANLILD
jgi:hypothetical protein